MVSSLSGGENWREVDCIRETELHVNVLELKAAAVLLEGHGEHLCAGSNGQQSSDSTHKQDSGTNFISLVPDGPGVLGLVPGTQCASPREALFRQGECPCQLGILSSQQQQ